MQPREVVHRFLASIGQPKAAEQYLALFQAAQKKRFALIHISSVVANAHPHTLLADLRFLQALELTPVICVSDSTTQSFLHKLFSAKIKMSSCALAHVHQVSQSGKIPLLVLPSAEDRAHALATLESRKFIVLIVQSGLQPKGEAVRSLINFRLDREELQRPDMLPPYQAQILTEVQKLFSVAKHHFTISVTSPQDLLRELFTMKGAGTLIRRGTPVQRLQQYAELDEKKLKALFQSAFSKSPSTAAFSRPLKRIFLAGDYQGVALVEDQQIAPYLSKFAVQMRAQGEGIGRDLWNALASDYKQFYWRSRPSNLIASWYAGQCDGLVRTDKWTVYWRGIAHSRIEAVIQEALQAPEDFTKNTSCS